MRAHAAAFALLASLLAGCTSPADPMLASTYTLPNGIELMATSDPGFDDYTMLLGLKQNPGAAKIPEAGPDGADNVPSRMAAAVLVREAPVKLTFLSVSYTRTTPMPAEPNPGECAGRPMWVLVLGLEVAEVRLQTPAYSIAQWQGAQPSQAASGDSEAQPGPANPGPSQAVAEQAWADVDAMGKAIQDATGAFRVC